MCDVGSLYDCELEKRPQGKCSSSITRDRYNDKYSYNKSANTCIWEDEGLFELEQECIKQCVKTFGNLSCSCVLLESNMGHLNCPGMLLSNKNLTITPHAVRHNVKLSCRKVKPKKKATLEDLLRTCKSSKCDLHTIQDIYSKLENVTSRNVREGGSFSGLAQQVKFVGEAVDVFKVETNFNYTVTKGLASSLLRSSDNIISALHTSQLNNLTHKLVGYLEGTAPVIVRAIHNEQWRHEEFAFHSHNIDMMVSSAKSKAQPQNTEVHLNDSEGTSAAKLTLHTLNYYSQSTANCSSDCATGVGVVLLKNVSALYPLDVGSGLLTRESKEKPDVRLVSSVLSIVALWDGKHVRNITGTFQLPNEIINSGGKPRCVFWDESIASPSQGAWSSSGLRVISTRNDNTECWTNHLTSFAILLQVVHVEIPAEHALALEIITYVGSSIGLVCLLVSILIFSLLLRSLSALRHRIHLNICIVLAIAHVTFLAGINATNNKAACTFVAVMLHYLYTAAFSWMCVEGIHLYFMVVHVYNTQSLKMRYYMLMGWGLPVVVVSVSMAANIDGYGTENACWISIETGLIWAFVVPVIIFIMINIVILVRVLLILLSLHESPLSPDEGKRARKAMRGVVALTPLLGLSWVFGLMCVNSSTIAFQYLFAILNTLQGAFLFGFHCLGNSQVRAALRIYMDRQWQIFNFRLSSRNSRNTGRTTRDLETHVPVIQKTAGTCGDL